MKGFIMKTKALYLIAALGLVFGLNSCNLDVFPSDELNSDLLLQDAKGAEYIMNGCYAVLKDEVDFLGYASGNCYVRHYFQLSEFPGDNTCLSAHTTDPLYEATALMMTDALKNVGTLWMVAYKAIYMCNTVISTLDASNPDNQQLLGEAYFMRGLLHLHLVTLYAKPYSFGRGEMGIPLRTSTDSKETVRNPVGDVYDQIAADLRQAADMLVEQKKRDQVRGNAGYPCKEAALGVLSRVYLYMEEYDKCIAAVNEALDGATPESKLEPSATFSTYFAKAKTSKETLFCIAHETSDDRGQSSIGSMYLKDGIGWGEIYASSPLMYLYERYPEDIRLTGFIVPQYKNPDATKLYAYVPVLANASVDNGTVLVKCEVIDDGANIKTGSKVYPLEKRMIRGDRTADPSGEYYEYHVANFEYEVDDPDPSHVDDDGKPLKVTRYMEDVLVRVNKDMVLRTGFSYPMIFINKFSYQDGNPMLSSPVLCRWGEVILNRAEAYARTGKDAEALADVNVIRTRAGIPAEGMFSAGNMHGYSNSADVVMDERRMELAFEGHRVFDVYRNKQKMDRRFAGAHPWKIIDPMTEPHIVYPIPNNEWTVSGIPQNPGY